MSPSLIKTELESTDSVEQPTRILHYDDTRLKPRMPVQRRSSLIVAHAVSPAGVGKSGQTT